MSVYAPEYYDPLDTRNIAVVVCRELERRPLVPIEPDIPPFEGSGLYAIYCTGSSVPLYAPLAPHGIPVYVGRSVSRDDAAGPVTTERFSLWSQLRDHKRSIEEGGLPAEEFAVRLLRTPDVHAELGRHGLRVAYQPVWNTVLTGFDDAEYMPSTWGNARTEVDTALDGRSRADDIPYDRDELIARTQEHIERQIANLANVPWRD